MQIPKADLMVVHCRSTCPYRTGFSVCINEKEPCDIARGLHHPGHLFLLEGMIVEGRAKFVNLYADRSRFDRGRPWR
jgi:hypothetical protein